LTITSLRPGASSIAINPRPLREPESGTRLGPLWPLQTREFITLFGGAAAAVSGSIAEWFACEMDWRLYSGFFSYVGGDFDGSRAADECRRLC
jgi:hypothetical protein